MTVCNLINEYKSDLFVSVGWFVFQHWQGHVTISDRSSPMRLSLRICLRCNSESSFGNKNVNCCDSDKVCVSPFPALLYEKSMVAVQLLVVAILWFWAFCWSEWRWEHRRDKRGWPGLLDRPPGCEVDASGFWLCLHRSVGLPAAKFTLILNEMTHSRTKPH